MILRRFSFPGRLYELLQEFIGCSQAIGPSIEIERKFDEIFAWQRWTNFIAVVEKTKTLIFWHDECVKGRCWILHSCSQLVIVPRGIAFSWTDSSILETSWQLSSLVLFDFNEQKGVLTPTEFVLAGDELCFRCPTWSWYCSRWAHHHYLIAWCDTGAQVMQEMRGHTFQKTNNSWLPEMVISYTVLFNTLLSVVLSVPSLCRANEYGMQYAADLLVEDDSTTDAVRMQFVQPIARIDFHL